MKILAFTTRDYYDIVNSDLWVNINCQQLIDYISHLYENPEDKNRNVRKFYKTDKEAEGFWEEYRGEFSMRKREDKDSGIAMYIIPCIPRDHLEEKGICTSMKHRHDYLGAYLKCIIQDNNTPTAADDIFIAAHDLDVFSQNDERNFSKNDLQLGSILSQLIEEGTIKEEHIFGFQHENKKDSFYSLFNQKLGTSFSLNDLFEEISKTIVDSTKKKTNSIIIDNNTSKKIATAHPREPILFSYTIDSHGNFSCEIPQKYKEDGYQEYSSLVKEIQNQIKDNTNDFEKGTYSAYLLIHHFEDIKGHKSRGEQYVFGQNYFKESEAFIPIIHFCDVSLKDLEELFRYSAVIDSSIWNYFSQIELNDRDKSISIVDTCQLLYAFKSISFNSNRCVYNLVVARESADLVARFTYNAFIKRFPKTEGHGDNVSPFVFHSEQGVKQLIQEEFDGTGKIKQIKKNKWRILLIDDKSIEKMGTTMTEDKIIDGLPFNCKLTVIKGVLEQYLGKIASRSWNDNKDLDTNTGILIEFAQSRKDASEALKAKKYDIILLDYLLDKGTKGHNYGYQVLDDIYTVCASKTNMVEKRTKDTQDIKIGSNGRFFFMFTSAYSSAVSERLLAEGLNLSEEFWHISLGACPTNTPQLFFYNFIKLMEKRHHDSGVDKLSAKGIYDIVNDIFGKTKGNDIRSSVRERANKYYQKILDLHYLYRKMLQDVQIPPVGNSIFTTEGSVLITNFIINNVNLGGFLEHLTQLVHITAFGTVRQWPEMWEEYIYFKTQFDLSQYEKVSKLDGDENARDRFYKLCEDIESYILNLKTDIG